MREPYAVRSGTVGALRQVTIELPHLHAVSVTMFARVGSRWETARDNGLSHFLEHMLFRGTESLPGAFPLHRELEGLGATLYAETGRDYSLYQITLPPDSLAEGLLLFGEIFRSPAFTEIEVERRIVLEEMREDVDDRGRLTNLDDLGRAAVWPDHPLGFRITGPVENVRRFNLRDVRRHFARFYGARNMILAVAGPVEHRKITRLTKRAFADLHDGTEQPLRAPREAQTEPQFVHVAEDSSQTQLQMLFRALPELDPDYPSLLMLMRVLDDGMSTRLHSRLCDELGLAYHVSAGLEPFVDTGLIEIDGAAKPNSAPALVRESLALCAALAADGPRAEELAKAKRRYQWDLQRSFDDADAMAGWWGGSRLFYPPLGFAAKLSRVAAVTKESVQRAAARVFRPERLTVVGVGPAGRKAQLASAARGFGVS